MSEASFGYGQMEPGDFTSEYDAHRFQIEQILGKVRTLIVVKVVAVNGGGVGAVPPTVDVHPLVKMLDGNNNAFAHGNVLGLPVMRWQSGGNAIVVDPQVGDIGVVGICDRDISSVKSSGQESTPGSLRRFALPDGIYLGGILNGKPTQTIAFTATGISLADKNGNKLESDATGWNITGNINVTGTVIAGKGTADQVSLQTHKHAGVTTGGGLTAAPVAGS